MSTQTGAHTSSPPVFRCQGVSTLVCSAWGGRGLCQGTDGGDPAGGAAGARRGRSPTRSLGFFSACCGRKSCTRSRMMEGDGRRPVSVLLLRFCTFRRAAGRCEPQLSNTVRRRRVRGQRGQGREPASSFHSAAVTGMTNTVHGSGAPKPPTTILPEADHNKPAVEMKSCSLSRRLSIIGSDGSSPWDLPGGFHTPRPPWTPCVTPPQPTLSLSLHCCHTC